MYTPSPIYILLLQFVFSYHIPHACAHTESRRQFNKCGEISIVLCCRSLINCRLESIISWLTGKTSEARCAAIPYKRRHANAEGVGEGVEEGNEGERRRGGGREDRWKWKKHSSPASTMSVVYPTSRLRHTLLTPKAPARLLFARRSNKISVANETWNKNEK